MSGIPLVAARLNGWCSPHDPANATHIAFPLAEAEALEALYVAARAYAKASPKTWRGHETERALYAALHRLEDVTRSHA